MARSHRTQEAGVSVGYAERSVGVRRADAASWPSRLTSPASCGCPRERDDAHSAGRRDCAPCPSLAFPSLRSPSYGYARTDLLHGGPGPRPAQRWQVKTLEDVRRRYTTGVVYQGPLVECRLVQGFRDHRPHIPDPWLRTLDPRSPDRPPPGVAGVQRRENLPYREIGYGRLLGVGSAHHRWAGSELLRR